MCLTNKLNLSQEPWCHMTTATVMIMDLHSKHGENNVLGWYQYLIRGVPIVPLVMQRVEHNIQHDWYVDKWPTFVTVSKLPMECPLPPIINPQNHICPDITICTHQLASQLDHVLSYTCCDVTYQSVSYYVHGYFYCTRALLAILAVIVHQ